MTLPFQFLFQSFVAFLVLHFLGIYRILFQYSQDLLNNLFRHPYTKIEFLMNDINVSRLTAKKYLDMLVNSGFLEKQKVWKTNYYINRPLFELFKGNQVTDNLPVIRTVNP